VSLTLTLMDEIRRRIESSRGFEVVREGSEMKVRDVRGIVKTSISRTELKGVRRTRRVPLKVREIVLKVSEILVSKNIPFKVTFGPSDAIVRFDLDHYIHIYKDKVRVIGFNSLQEEPLSALVEALGGPDKIKILRPIK